MRVKLVALLLCISLAVQAQEFSHNKTSVPVEDKSTQAVITLPQGEGPFPALVIIAGSGMTDYDGNSVGLPGKNNSLKLLAEGLAKQGYASIRYNKRIFVGFKEDELTLDDFVTDAISAYDLLVQDERISKIGFAGHSQGSLVGMLAAQKREAAFYISIAGPGQDFADIISKQLKANPNNPPIVIQEAERIMKSLKEGKPAENVPPYLNSLFRPSVQGFIGSWMKYDPKEEIAKLTMPVMIINGGRDIQVGLENVEPLREAVKAKVVVLTLDEMNHVLKDAPEDRQGNIATYSDESLPLSIGLIAGIKAFLTVNLKNE